MINNQDTNYQLYFQGKQREDYCPIFIIPASSDLLDLYVKPGHIIQEAQQPVCYLPPTLYFTDNHYHNTTYNCEL